MNDQNYYEWMYLLTEAREKGLSDSEIRSFLKDMMKINDERKAAGNKKFLQLVFKK